MGDDVQPKLGFAALLASTTAAQAEMEDEAAADMFGQAPAPRGVGRPKGSRNKATESQAEYIKRVGMSPLRFLQTIWTDPEKPLRERVQAAVASLPYVHKKQPVAVDLTEHKIYQLVIEAPPGGLRPGEAADGAVEVAYTLVEPAKDGNDDKSKP